jgi:hypothetical protein
MSAPAAIPPFGTAAHRTTAFVDYKKFENNPNTLQAGTR